MPHTVVQVFRKADGTSPLLEWLDELKVAEPSAYAACLERVLRLQTFGSELRRPHADALRDGIRELRARVGNVHYRMLYSFVGKNQAVITHGLTKQGEVPKREIDFSIACMKLIRSNPGKYIAVLELD